jgi:hypothetical protein
LPAPVEALAPVIGGFSTELAVPRPLANEVATFSPSGFRSQSIQIDGIGPARAFTFAPLPEQDQSDPVFLIQSELNGPPADIQQELIVANEDGDAFARSVALGLDGFASGFPFPRDIGAAFEARNQLLALVRANKLLLAQPEVDGIQIVGEQSSPSGARFFYGDFLGSGAYPQLLGYRPSDPNLYLYVIEEEDGQPILLEPIVYELAGPVQMASRFVREGEWLVAVAYAGSSDIDLLSLADEKVVDTLSMTSTGNPLTAIVSMNGDRLLALSGDSGRSAHYELFGDDGSGDLVSLYADALPTEAFDTPLAPNRPQVFFFDQSPLASGAANLMAWYGGFTSWGSDPELSFASVQFQAWIDRGANIGLAKTFKSSTVVPDDSYAFLANQINASASLSGLGIFGSADRNLRTSWEPRPGSYDTVSPIAASFPEDTELSYRTDPSAAWQSYTGPIFPQSEAFSIQYFLTLDDGSKGPVESVDYQFSRSALNRDSNGDGIPNYVQGHLGLNFLGTGDSDEDGVSDLDELQAGTSATDPGDTPAGAARLDRGLEENLILTSRNAADALWAPGSFGFVDQVSGSRLGSAAVEDGFPYAVLPDIETSQAEGMLAVSTEPLHRSVGDAPEAASGLENLALIPAGSAAPFEVSAPYTGGPIEPAATAWVENLRSSALPDEAEDRNVPLSPDSTGLALALEWAFETLLQDEGFLEPDEQLTLFPGRTGDERFMDLSEIVERADAANGPPPFAVSDLWDDLDLPGTLEAAETDYDELPRWQSFVLTVYTDFPDSEIKPVTGQGPVDILRAVLRQQSLPDGVAAALSLDPLTVEQVVGEAQALRSSFVRDNRQTLELTIDATENIDCLTASSDFAVQYALVDELGERFVPSKALDLLPGTRIRVEGVVRPEWPACLGTALEVRGLTVLEVPPAAAVDADGNLLDDQWELYWLGTGDYDPFASLDGSGYSLLQQFFSGSDPTSATSLPEGPVEDLTPPQIDLELTAPDEVTLSWTWPGEYSDLIRFKLIQSDELGNLHAIVPTSVDYDQTGDDHEMRITVPEADQGFFKLVLSLD